MKGTIEVWGAPHALFPNDKSVIADAARIRVLYGKKFVAIRTALGILEFSKRWDDWQSFYSDRRTQMMMKHLIRCALEWPDHLRDIADAFIQLQRGGIKTANDRAVVLELLTAYESCVAATPVLPEIRRVFIDRYGKARWPGDPSARRTFLALNIPLGKAKRGRPKGAKSKQKEYGLGQQPRKLIHTKG